MRLRAAWPELASFPAYGLVRTRLDFDEMLAGTRSRPAPGCARAPTSPARSSTPPAAIVGVTAKAATRRAGTGPELRTPRRWSSPPTATPRGFASRWASTSATTGRWASRSARYYTSPRHDDDYLESWLELWAPTPTARVLLPGYGWIFGVGDGTSNVGLGILNTSGAFGKTDYRPAQPLARQHARGVGLPRRERDRPDPRRRAADGLQPHSRTTPAACCWSATPAAWSTRSTARASRTRWSPAAGRRGRRPGAGPRRRAAARARRCRPTRGAWRDALRRLLHARPCS